MSDYRGAHQAGVANALAAIESFEAVLRAATEACDVASDAVVAATGGVNLESANNASSFLRMARESVGEAFRQASVSADELRRYGSGF